MEQAVLHAFCDELTKNAGFLDAGRAVIGKLGLAAPKAVSRVAPAAGGLAGKLESVGKAAPWQGGLAAPIPKTQALGEQSAGIVRRAAAGLKSAPPAIGNVRYTG